MVNQFPDKSLTYIRLNLLLPKYILILIFAFFIRVDVDYYLGNCEVQQIKDMFANFFPLATMDEINKLQQIFDQRSIKSYEEDPVSPSEFQRHLFRFSTSVSDALKNVNLLKDYLYFVSDDHFTFSDSDSSVDK